MWMVLLVRSFSFSEATHLIIAGTSSAPGNTNVPPGSVSATSTSSPNNTGAIVGGVIGGLAVLVLCGMLVLLWRRRNPKVHQGAHIGSYIVVGAAH